MRDEPGMDSKKSEADRVNRRPTQKRRREPGFLSTPSGGLDDELQLRAGDLRQTFPAERGGSKKDSCD